MTITAKALPLACLAMLTLLGTPAFGQGTGRSLDIQPGGRQNALGEAGAAMFDQPGEAMWWNPAALGSTHGTLVHGTRAQLVPGLSDHVMYYHASVAAPLGPRAGVGASFTRLNYQSLEGFGPRSFETSPAITLGVQVIPGLSVGGTLKWIEMSLGGAVGSTYGGDVGALWTSHGDKLSYGLGSVYQNFGGKILDGPLSRNIKLGASADLSLLHDQFFRLGTVLVLDHNRSQVTTDFTTWGGGSELYFEHRDGVRVAARLGYHSDPDGQITDFTFGGGIRARFLEVDSAWIPQADDSGLNRVFKLTVGIRTDSPSRHGALSDNSGP